MVFLVNCKNEDPIKNDGSKLFTTLNIDLSDTQGQLTRQSMVGFS